MLAVDRDCYFHVAAVHVYVVFVNHLVRFTFLATFLFCFVFCAPFSPSSPPSSLNR